jgi:sulfur carrier protein ThiS
MQFVSSAQWRAVRCASPVGRLADSEVMKITLKLHASLMDRLPPGTQGHAVVIDVDSRTTVGDVLERYALSPAVAKLVLVNGHYIAPEARATATLAEGDQLAIWPPVAGG